MVLRPCATRGNTRRDATLIRSNPGGDGHCRHEGGRCHRQGRGTRLRPSAAQRAGLHQDLYHSLNPQVLISPPLPSRSLPTYLLYVAPQATRWGLVDQKQGAINLTPTLSLTTSQHETQQCPLSRGNVPYTQCPLVELIVRVLNAASYPLLAAHTPPLCNGFQLRASPRSMCTRCCGVSMDVDSRQRVLSIPSSFCSSEISPDCAPTEPKPGLTSSPRASALYLYISLLSQVCCKCAR